VFYNKSLYKKFNRYTETFITNVSNFIVVGLVISWKRASKFDEVTLLRYGIQPHPFYSTHITNVLQ
jgi:hypothetical protein